MTLPAGRLRGPFLAAGLAAVLAACGGTSPSAQPSTASQAAAPSPPDAPTEAPTPAPTDAPTPAPTDAPSAAPSAGASLATTGRIEVADAGFAITLPEGWTRVDLNAQDMDAILEQFSALDPETAQAYAQQIQGLLAAGLRVFAFSPDLSANVNVLTIPAMGVSLDLIEQLNVTQVEQFAVGDVSSERVDLPAGEAIHLTYDVDNGAGQQVSLDQYLLIADGQQLVVTVTGGTAADATAIAESIEILE